MSENSKQLSTSISDLSRAGKRGKKYGFHLSKTEKWGKKKTPLMTDMNLLEELAAVVDDLGKLKMRGGLEDVVDVIRVEGETRRVDKVEDGAQSQRRHALQLDLLQLTLLKVSAREETRPYNERIRFQLQRQLANIVPHEAKLQLRSSSSSTGRVYI